MTNPHAEFARVISCESIGWSVRDVLRSARLPGKRIRYDDGDGPPLAMAWHAAHSHTQRVYANKTKKP